MKLNTRNFITNYHTSITYMEHISNNLQNSSELKKSNVNEINTIKIEIINFIS